jgi:hypothetical protein
MSVKYINQLVSSYLVVNTEDIDLMKKERLMVKSK